MPRGLGPLEVLGVTLENNKTKPDPAFFAIRSRAKACCTTMSDQNSGTSRSSSSFKSFRSLAVVFHEPSIRAPDPETRGCLIFAFEI